MKAMSFFLPVLAATAMGFAADENAMQPAKPGGPTLKAGDAVTIDALKSAQWIQGEAPESWEPGKLYIIECWATWCGPCVAVIPHMNELYKSRAKDGLRVIGMNVWENRTKTEDPEKLKEGSEKALKKATDFVNGKGEGMSYPIAFASRDGEFTKSWLKAAGVKGIPHAFVVKDGKLLFTTHPARLDDETITGLLAGGDAQAKALKKIGQQDRSREQMGTVMREFQLAQRSGDTEKMAAAIGKLEKINPKTPFLPQMRLDLAIASEDWDKASDGVKAVGTGAGSARMLTSLAFRLGANPDKTPAKMRKTVADQCAKALENAPANPTAFVVLSRLYWTLDDKESALKAAQSAAANHGALPAAPFEKFAESVEAGKPMATSDVFGQVRKAMMEQAKETSGKADKELKENIEKKQKPKPGQ